MEDKAVFLLFTLVLLTSCGCLDAAPTYDNPNTRTERTRLSGSGFTGYEYPVKEHEGTDDLMQMYQDEEDKRMAEAILSNNKSGNVYKLGRLQTLKAILQDITGKSSNRKRAADLDVDNHAYKFSWTSHKKDSNVLQVGDLVELILNQKVQLP